MAQVKVPKISPSTKAVNLLGLTDAKSNRSMSKSDSQIEREVRRLIMELNQLSREKIKNYEAIKRNAVELIRLSEAKLKS